MTTLRITFRRTDPEQTLEHLTSIVAKELEKTVRALPDVNGDVSPGDYTIDGLDTFRDGEEIVVKALLIVDA